MRRDRLGRLGADEVCLVVAAPSPLWLEATANQRRAVGLAGVAAGWPPATGRAASSEGNTAPEGIGSVMTSVRGSRRCTPALMRRGLGRRAEPPSPARRCPPPCNAGTTSTRGRNTGHADKRACRCRAWHRDDVGRLGARDVRYRLR